MHESKGVGNEGVHKKPGLKELLHTSFKGIHTKMHKSKGVGNEGVHKKPCLKELLHKNSKGNHTIVHESNELHNEEIHEREVLLEETLQRSSKGRHIRMQRSNEVVNEGGILHGRTVILEVRCVGNGYFKGSARFKRALFHVVQYINCAKI